MSKNLYTYTSLMRRIEKIVSSRMNPPAFILGDLGNGPILKFGGNYCRPTRLAVHLICGGQRLAFSHLTPSPYLLAVAQEAPDSPPLLSVYEEGPAPTFESEGEAEITGQIIAYAQSPNGLNLALAHAVLLPTGIHVLTDINRPCSIILEQHPEVCNHLLTCCTLIERLLQEKRS